MVRRCGCVTRSLPGRPRRCSSSVLRGCRSHHYSSARITAVDLTPAELTLLGLLVEKPRHGYELAEVIAARGMREWTEIGFSSIYYLLTKLRDRGLVAERGEPARGKARKVFPPPPDGFRSCAGAAEQAIATLRPVFPPLLVGLATQPIIPPTRL